MTSSRLAVIIVNAICTATGKANMLRIGLFSLLFAGSILAAAAGSTQITDTLTSIYCLLYGLVPLMAFTLFVLAGAAYGAGNFFGADIRAKANSWAMSCITGGIIALLIILFSDILIKNLMPGYSRPTC